MPTATVQFERPASCELLTRDHPATDRAMRQDYNGLPGPGQCFRVRFTPRPSHNGRELMPELQEYIGTELLVRPLWQMDDSDPYPGEWAMGNADCRNDLLGRAWIASGDLTIAPPEPTLDLDFTSIKPTTLAESGLTFTRATPAPDVKTNEGRYYWPERLSTDTLESITQYGLPAPWQWLKEAKPESGQHCEWVVLGASWTDSGQGEWTVIDTCGSVEGVISVPLGTRVTTSGFVSDKGLTVLDPTITAWRAI
jgi:hypothetical protein